MMTSKSYENFQFDVDERNIATISLNVPNRPVNILNETVISELDAIVREIERDASIQLSIFQSGKKAVSWLVQMYMPLPRSGRPRKPFE